MPINYTEYPANWQDIRASILERASHRCESCGVANYAVGARDRNGDWHDQRDIDLLNSDMGYYLFGEYPKIIKIVLTTAHVDHDIQNNDPSNLACWCQLCHNRHDAKHRAKNAVRTRKLNQGQLELFDLGE